MSIEDNGTQFDALSASDLRFGSARKFLADQGLSSIGFDNSQVGESGSFNVKKTGGPGIMSMDSDSDNSAKIAKLSADLKICLENKKILEGEIKVLEGIIDGLNNDIKDLREEIKVLEGTINGLNNVIKALEAEIISLNNIISILQGKLDTLCALFPRPDGSFSANRNVFYSVESGSCSLFTYYGHQYNSATLSRNLTFLGSSLGNGYAIINTTGTITALYQVRKSDDVEFAPDPVNTDGTFPCMPNYGNIQIKKYNPITAQYGSSQAGIETGAGGIGEYGVFHRTQYVWTSGSTLNPYRIGTIIKETSADEFIFTMDNDPCTI